MTRRQARRKLGSRSARRANTNGKGIAGKGGGKNQRKPCYRYPKPVKRLRWKVQRILEGA